MNIWKREKYFDTWSIVHFMSGVILGGVTYRLGLGFLWAVAIALAVILIWEVIEWIIKIIEPSPNVLTDIILGFGGFLSSVFYYYYLNQPFNLAVFTTVWALTLALALWGLIHHLNKNK